MTQTKTKRQRYSRRLNVRQKLAWMLSGLVCSVMATAAAPSSAISATLLPLYSFTGGADGGNANGGVIADAAGVLYGETENGGATNCTLTTRSGCGTVYSFNPTTGVFKVLVNFVGANGAYGTNPLLLSGSTLYGTTNGGGAKKDGVVFSVHTDGTAFTILHHFSGSDGLVPSGSLRLGPGAVLYGITEFGGANNDGVLYSIGRNGTYSILHTFTAKADGSVPQSLLISSNGILVGSATQGGSFSRDNCRSGCGNVFEYVPSTTAFKVLYTFTGLEGNGGEVGSIGPGPTVYGNDGTVPYSLDVKSGLVNIGCFACMDAGGSFGSGPLLAPDGSLIGVNGVFGFIQGSLYTASPSTGVLTILSGFGGTVGFQPVAQPVLQSSGNIVGTTVQGGLCPGCGTIWQYIP